MRVCFVPFLKIDLRAVVSLLLLGVAFPRLVGLPVRTLVGPLAWIVFRRLFAHWDTSALDKISAERAGGSSLERKVCCALAELLKNNRAFDPQRFERHHA
jgi:hypothetical protein